MQLILEAAKKQKKKVKAGKKKGRGGKNKRETQEQKEKRLEKEQKKIDKEKERDQQKVVKALLTKGKKAGQGRHILKFRLFETPTCKNPKSRHSLLFNSDFTLPKGNMDPSNTCIHSER